MLPFMLYKLCCCTSHNSLLVSLCIRSVLTALTGSLRVRRQAIRFSPNLPKGHVTREGTHWGKEQRGRRGLLVQSEAEEGK